MRRVDALIRRMKESNAQYSEAEVAADVEAAIQEVRRYGRNRSAHCR